MFYQRLFIGSLHLKKCFAISAKLANFQGATSSRGCEIHVCRLSMFFALFCNKAKVMVHFSTAVKVPLDRPLFDAHKGTRKGALSNNRN